jgi:glycosyltransferase involved in cell wall biosynthesis
MGLDSNITFTGWRHDLASIYSDIDVLVVSSDNEGTPVSAIEAMAASRPVVGTTVGGMPDLIENGRTGLLVPKGDEQSLADAVRRIIDNPELGRQIGLEARRDVSGRYTAQRLVTDVETLYANLISRVGLPRPPGL